MAVADEVLVDVAVGIMTVTINRPKAKNSINLAVAEGIAAAMCRERDAPSSPGDRSLHSLSLPPTSPPGSPLHAFWVRSSTGMPALQGLAVRVGNLGLTGLP